MAGEESEGRRLAPLWLLARASLRAHHLMNERFAGLGMRKWHYLVLTTLDTCAPATQIELGRRAGIDRSDMVALLNDLQDRGYVRREPDPADRRRNLVTLTPAGRAALRRLDTLADEAADAAFAPLRTHERAAFVDMLERIVRAGTD